MTNSPTRVIGLKTIQKHALRNIARPQAQYTLLIWCLHLVHITGTKSTQEYRLMHHLTSFQQSLQLTWPPAPKPVRNRSREYTQYDGANAVNNVDNPDKTEDKRRAV